MDTFKRIAKNTSILLISRVVGYALSFLYIISIARYLGTDEYGILSFALAFATIFSIFADLGLNTLIVREIAREKKSADKYLGNTILMKLFLSIITLVLVGLTINILGYDHTTIQVVYLIILYIICTSFSQTCYSIFQAYEQMEYQAIGEILNNILMFTGVLIVIYSGLNILSFALVYAIASITVLAVNLFLCIWRFITPLIEFNPEFMKITFKKALPFGITSIFVTMYFYIDTVMLSIIQESSAVGIYNAAYNLIFALTFIPSVFILSIFPVMSRHFKTAKNVLKIEYEKSVKYLLIISVFILVCGLIYSDKFIPLIYGENYISSIGAFNILIIVLPFLFLTSLFGNFLGAINKQIVVTFVALLNALLNIMLNLILIPKFSYLGASAATVFTECFGFILMFTYISKYFFKISITENLLKTTSVGFSVLLISYILKGQVNWILSLIISTIVYYLILYKIGVIAKEDIKLVKSLFPQKQSKKN